MTQPTPNYLQRILETGSCLERGRAYYAAVFHDDWCASNLTKNYQDCNCKPIVRVHSTPPECHWRTIDCNELCPCGSGRKYQKG